MSAGAGSSIAIITTNSSHVASDAEITPGRRSGLVLTEAGRSETGVLAAKPK